jgi:hypothetical protein
MIEIEGYNVPNLPHEITVAQFDKINFITSNQELDEIEKWMEKFKYLGVDESAFDDMELETFYGYIAKWNDQPPHPSTKVLEIEIDGYKYEAKESIGVKDLGMIEKIWKSGGDTFASDTLAILFKRTDLSKVEHYASSHLKHKSALFKKQTSDIVIPYIIDILSILTKTVQKTKDEVAKELEGNKG